MFEQTRVKCFDLFFAIVTAEGKVGKSVTDSLFVARVDVFEIADIVDAFQSIELQNCYMESDFPRVEIVHAYVPRSFTYLGRNVFLIHKSLAERMLKEKAVSEKNLRPALVVKDVPDGYASERTEVMDRPTADSLAKSIIEYENLKKKVRPTHTASETDALKKYRSAKSDRKQDFCKALPKAAADEISATKYAPLLPYYQIANGAYVSDEYNILPYTDALRETENFAETMKSEQLTNIPCGIVIAKCADGDTVLLLDSEKIIRISHEAPDACCEWVSLHAFIFDVTEL